MTPPSFLNKRTAAAAAPFPNRFRWLPDMAFARSGALPNSSAWGPDLLSPARDLIQKVPGVGDTGMPRNKRYAAIYIHLAVGPTPPPRCSQVGLRIHFHCR